MAETAKRGPGRPRRNSQVNEDTHKVEASHASPSAMPSKSESGRRTRRRAKGSVGGWRSKLNIHPKDESFFNIYTTRWVKDTDEGGHRLLGMYQDDWDFVRADEVIVGENFVYKSRGAESIVRVPAGDNLDSGHWMFLMKKYRDWYDADKRDEQKLVNEQEAYMNRKRDPDAEEDVGDDEGSTKGMYGEGKTKWLA